MVSNIIIVSISELRLLDPDVHCDDRLRSLMAKNGIQQLESFSLCWHWNIYIYIHILYICVCVL